MKVISLVQDKNRLIPVEVELTLLPGLPQIHFLGLPDQVIKESLHRIKCAIKNQGFEFPRTKQMIVNIRPNHLKKNSRGIEFAVASALLWETGQSPRPVEQSHFIIYGELGLNGEVYQPDDLLKGYSDAKSIVLTGAGSGRSPFARQRVRQLSEIAHPEYVPVDQMYYQSQRPEFGLSFSYPEKQARLMVIAAAGEHHTLLVGSAGAGKSTMAKTIGSLLAPPQAKDFSDGFVQKHWRPILSPHHSASALAMIGGGIPPKLGEISRAHRGLLILDEMLEFQPQVQEALREPLEEGVIRLSRGTQSEEFPADFMLVATTNLCPCGDRLPKKKMNCQYSRLRCDSVQQKLSGPFLDRFEILFFVDHEDRNQKSVSGQQILQQVIQAQKNIPQIKIDESTQKILKKLIGEKKGSQRRLNSTLKVARTVAALEGGMEINLQHLREALEMSWDSFALLRG